MKFLNLIMGYIILMLIAVMSILFSFMIDTLVLNLFDLNLFLFDNNIPYGVIFLALIMFICFTVIHLNKATKIEQIVD